MSVVLNMPFLVPIRTLWPEIFWSLGNMTLSNNTVKLALTEVDYKPFISMFNVTNATVTDPDISGIGVFVFCFCTWCTDLKRRSGLRFGCCFRAFTEYAGSI